MPPPPRELRKRSRCNAIGSFDELGLTSSRNVLNDWNEEKKDPDLTSTTDTDPQDHWKRHRRTELQDDESNPSDTPSTDTNNDTNHAHYHHSSRESNALEYDTMVSTRTSLKEDQDQHICNQNSNSTAHSLLYNLSSCDANDESRSRLMDSHRIPESSCPTLSDSLDQAISTTSTDSILLGDDTQHQNHEPAPSLGLDDYPFATETSTSSFHTTTTTSTSTTSRSLVPSQFHHSASNSMIHDESCINARFSDIVGHGSAKIRLDEMLLPLALPPSIAKRILTGVRAIPASILFYGPPGCGKTQLARAVAGEAQAAFLSIGPSDILSKFVGESEASVRDLFQQAKLLARRMESRCCVLFFDEIDALGVSRGGATDGGFAGAGGSENSSRRLLAELLIQLTNLDNEARYLNKNGDTCDEEDDNIDICSRSDVLECSRDDKDHDHQNYFSGNVTPDSSDHNDQNNSFLRYSRESLHDGSKFKSKSYRDEENYDTPPRVIVIAATNRPEDCDPALLRRFAIRVLVGLPTERDRLIIISRLLKNIHHNLTVEDLKQLAAQTEGWSGSDLESVSREAVMSPIREVLRKAAVLKSSSRKIDRYEKCDSDEIYQIAARDMLLKGFQDLRPVSLKDFDDAISFWIGDGQDDIASRIRKDCSRSFHYDSDSTENDLELDNVSTERHQYGDQIHE